MTEDELSKEILNAAFVVHSTLGPGLLESVYEKALSFELEKSGVQSVCQAKVPLIYKGVQIDNAFLADIIVEDKVIIELKSVKAIEDIHKKQLFTYLKLSNRKLGLLLNFNAASLKNGIVRVVNSL